jgi:hypothetical protein
VALALCLAAGAALPAASSQRGSKTPASLEGFLRSSPVVVLAEVEKFRSEVLAKNSSTPLAVQRNTVRIIEWLKVEPGTLQAAGIEFSQCMEGLDCQETPLQLNQRCILFLDRWTAANAYGTTYGDSSVWTVEGNAVQLPLPLTRPGGSFEGVSAAPLDTVLARIRETAAAISRSPLSNADRGAIDGYRSYIRNATADREGRWIEMALAAFESVRASLMAVRNGQTVLELLSAAEFREVRAALPGVMLGRDGTIYVEPDVDYLVAFAGEHGTPVDRAFVAVLKTTYSRAPQPVYLEQQIGHNACTRFGSGTLIDVYRRWSDFARQNPGRFASVQRYQQDVVRQLTTATCACGTNAEVERELSGFLAEFPSAPERALVESRLADVRAKRAGIRANCKSG